MSGGFCTRPMLIEALDSKLRRAVRARGFSPVTTPRLKLNSSLLVLRDAVDYATARMVHGQVAVRRPVLWGCLDNLRGQTPNLPLQQHAQLRRADYPILRVRGRCGQSRCRRHDGLQARHIWSVLTKNENYPSKGSISILFRAENSRARSGGWRRPRAPDIGRTDDSIFEWQARRHRQGQPSAHRGGRLGR